jgi:hypothetical protein
MGFCNIRGARLKPLHTGNEFSFLESSRSVTQQTQERGLWILCSSKTDRSRAVGLERNSVLMHLSLLRFYEFRFLISLDNVEQLLLSWMQSCRICVIFSLLYINCKLHSSIWQNVYKLWNGEDAEGNSRGCSELQYKDFPVETEANDERPKLGEPVSRRVKKPSPAKYESKPSSVLVASVIELFLEYYFQFCLALFQIFSSFKLSFPIFPSTDPSSRTSRTIEMRDILKENTIVTPTPANSFNVQIPQSSEIFVV